MSDLIKVGVMGAAGRMGREIARALAADPELEPAAAFDVAFVGEDWGALAGIGALGVTVCGDIDTFLIAGPAMVVDVSTGPAAAQNAPKVLERGIPLVIGATGLPNASLDAIGNTAEKAGVCCLLVPNFSIGANLMIALSRRAAPFFSAAEVQERHHPAKKDAPSGTALFTVSEIAAANPQIASAESEHEIVAGARGAKLDEVRIHSVRLPGILAEQTVTFGGPGEVLEITHRAISRECYMPGVIWALKHVRTAPAGLLIGLDQVLGIARE
ncbi:MAG: 4-hydroxy-tetrahydrodipicolinate reductase [bacterium]|jgi:4-hydroxy-tetrahydrodipicolinate reductase